MSGSSIPAENHAYRSPTLWPASHAASPVINLRVRQILRSPPCCARLLIMNQCGCAPTLRDLDGYHFATSCRACGAEHGPPATANTATANSILWPPTSSTTGQQPGHDQEPPRHHGRDRSAAVKNSN